MADLCSLECLTVSLNVDPVHTEKFLQKISDMQSDDCEYAALFKQIS